MLKSVRVAVVTVFGLSMLAATAQAAVLFGPGETYVANFDVTTDPKTPPYFLIGLEMYFDTSDWLDVVDGEGVIVEILDSSENVVGTFNSIDSFDPPSPSLSAGFSTAFTFDTLLNDAIGSVVVSSIGSSTFLLNDIIISLVPAPPETGQTDFLFLIDDLELVEATDMSEVPVPAAFILFLAGLSGIFRFMRLRI